MSAMIVLYGAAKLAAYTAWCGLGMRVVWPAGATLWSAMRFGAVRWLLGLVFGVAVFIVAGSIDASDAARLYFFIYTPVRAVEWGVMAFLIGRAVRDDARRPSSATIVLWCGGGIILSFLTDLLSPDGLQGRFCVGRCLC